MHDDGEPPTPRVRYGEVTGCVLDLINKNAEGLTAQEVKAELERKFGSRIGRRSHATILCRLQSEGKVIRKGRKWLKIRVQSGWKKAADSLSPA